MRFMAYVADGHSDTASASAYDPTKSTWLPYYQHHTLRAYCTGTECLSFEVTATEHGAIMRFKFPRDTSQSAPHLDGGWNTTRRIEISMNTAQTQAGPTVTTTTSRGMRHAAYCTDARHTVTIFPLLGCDGGLQASSKLVLEKGYRGAPRYQGSPPTSLTVAYPKLRLCTTTNTDLLCLCVSL